MIEKLVAHFRWGLDFKCGHLAAQSKLRLDQD